LTKNKEAKFCMRPNMQLGTGHDLL